MSATSDSGRAAPPVTVHPLAFAHPARASVLWDRECFTLLGSVAYQHAAVRPGGAPEQPFDLPAATRVIVAGPLALTLDDLGRLTAFDFYTNPAGWRRAERLPVARPAIVTPRLAGAFDALGRLGAREPAAWHARATDTLRLVWRDASVWYAIAPGVSVAAADDGTLAQLDIAGFPLPVAAQ